MKFFFQLFTRSAKDYFIHKSPLYSTPVSRVLI